MGGEGKGHCTAALQALDAAVALVFVSPLVVAYWRGCWQLMDLLLFPENFPVSVYSSIFIGIVLHLLFCVFQKTLEKVTGDSVNMVVYLVVSRMYTVLFSVACVSHWRGVWLLWDLYTGTSWQSGLLSFGLGFCLLIIANAVRNILAPPFVSYADAPEGYFTVPTLFNPQVQIRNTTMWLWLIDCAFTVVMVDSLVVFVWRGGWLLLDSFLYPTKPALSAIGSTIIGASISVVAFLTRPMLNSALKSLRLLWLKVSLELFFYAFCFAATVNLWRGVWKSLDHFFLPNDRLMSNLISAVVGQTLLLLFWCSNSNPVRGAVPDLRELGKPGVVFSISYLSYFWQKFHDEKQTRGEDLWQTPRNDQETSVKSKARKCNGGLACQSSGSCSDVTGASAAAHDNDAASAVHETECPVSQNRDVHPVQHGDVLRVHQKDNLPVQSKDNLQVQTKNDLLPQNKDINPAQNEGTHPLQNKDITCAHNKDTTSTQNKDITSAQNKDIFPSQNNDTREVLSLESIPSRDIP